MSVETYDMVGLEARMHKHFIDSRREGKREWYNVTNELRYVIASLMKMNAPTEFDLGQIFGQYEVYKQAHDKYQSQIKGLQRTVALAELRQIEQWAQSYAIGAMKFSQYPAYKFRYNEAREYLKTLEAGEVPLFITDQFNNLVVTEDSINTEAA